MGYLKKYKIRFKELDLGEHRFDFEIGELFFAEFEQSEIQQGNIRVGVNLIKEERLITLNIEMKGEVEVMCDRCLENFGLPLEFEGTVYIKPKTETEEEKIDKKEVNKLIADALRNFGQQMMEE